MGRKRSYGVLGHKDNKLEKAISEQIQAREGEVHYEEHKVSYLRPIRSGRCLGCGGNKVAQKHIYTPDFKLKNGIFIEAKGRFLSKDRTKHKLVRDQLPEIDIRFVFSNSNKKLSKNAAGTYASWCVQQDFKYADKLIPEEWFDE